MAGWLRLGLVTLIGLITWTHSARARDAKKTAKGEEAEGAHLHAIVTPLVMTLGRYYDIQVRHPNGRFGVADFHAYRTGFGFSVTGGLGVRLSRLFVLGVELEHARVYAPLTHEFAERIGAEFEPWVTTWLLGPVLELNTRWGVSGAFSIGYARVREVLSAPTERIHAEDLYGMKLFVSRHWSIGGQARFALGLRLGAVDANPFGLVAIVWREPLLPRTARAVDAGVGLSLEFN